MTETLIHKLHTEFKETKQITLPAHLLPFERGYNLIAWARELFVFYRQDGIIVRPFDDLPPLKLSGQDSIATTLQNVHAFIVNDLNLIPLDVRRQVLEHAAAEAGVEESWERIAPLLAGHLKNADDEELREELSWTFSPVVEVLHALTWFFMEKERITPPAGTRLEAGRFPYYLWLTDEGRQAMWEPESPYCRREWLALDLYRRLTSC
jgi:hypothetical protein